MVRLALVWLVVQATALPDLPTLPLLKLEAALSRGEWSVLQPLLNQGGLAVTGLGGHYEDALSSLRAAAPACLASLPAPLFPLEGGGVRQVAAVAGPGPQHWPPCLAQPATTLGSHLAAVEQLVARALGGVLGRPALLTNLTTQGSRHYKEQVQVSWGGGARGGAVAQLSVPWHTDRGLLLTLTPAPHSALLVRGREGGVLTTGRLPRQSVIVLLGAGLPDWLGVASLPAAPHAVPGLPAAPPRPVLARMLLAPPAATRNGVTFQKFFTAAEVAAGPAAARWARVKRSECEAGEEFCWMTCLALPEAGCSAAPQCLNRDGAACCTRDTTENCADMDASCAWQCHHNTTAEQREQGGQQDGQQGGQQGEKAGQDGQFCRGPGTDMFMQGFTASGNPREACVILLFSSWTLDTRAKFAAGCLGVILLGIAIEALLCFRRLVQSRRLLGRITGTIRRGVIVFLFGLNILSGYLAMLVAMTYSVELFLCMVAGLVAGHAIFNTGAAVGESVDPCCASQRDPEPLLVTKAESCCQLDKETCPLQQDVS